MRIKAPIIIRIVCTKSVQITAVRPPVMVKTAAIASKIKTLKYNQPSFVVCPRASVINKAPANRSA